MRIVYTNENGVASVIIPTSPDLTEEQLVRTLPEGTTYIVLQDADVPADRLFRQAWVMDQVNNKIEIDLTKAKSVAHEKRRIKRDELFAPYDDIIAKQIPGDDLVQAEANRETIRTADANTQNQIDSASDVDSLKTIITTYLGL